VQLVASVGLIVTGLILAIVVRADPDYRIFGWILVGVGVLGLIARSVIARLRDHRPPGER
jgi:hypothetical protein